MKKLYYSLVSIFVLIGCNSGKMSRSATSDYASTVRTAIGVLGWDLEGYFFRATPVGNFGIGTMYLNENNSDDPRVIESHWLLSHPNIWFEEITDEATKSRILNRIVIEGSFGNLSNQSTLSRTTNSQVGLPILKAYLDINIGINLEKGVKSKISADQAVLRRIVWPEFQEAILENKLSKSVSRVFKANNYSIAASDIVLRNYKVSIEVDKTINPDLSIKLDSSVGNVIGKGGLGTFTLNKVSEGKYEAVATSDVIAAVLFKTPPPEQDRYSTNPSEWRVAAINAVEFQKIEKQVSSGKK